MCLPRHFSRHCIITIGMFEFLGEPAQVCNFGQIISTISVLFTHAQLSCPANNSSALFVFNTIPETIHNKHYSLNYTSMIQVANSDPTGHVNKSLIGCVLALANCNLRLGSGPVVQRYCHGVIIKKS